LEGVSAHITGLLAKEIHKLSLVKMENITIFSLA